MKIRHKWLRYFSVPLKSGGFGVALLNGRGVAMKRSHVVISFPVEMYEWDVPSGVLPDGWVLERALPDVACEGLTPLIELPVECIGVQDFSTGMNKTALLVGRPVNEVALSNGLFLLSKVSNAPIRIYEVCVRSHGMRSLLELGRGVQSIRFVLENGSGVRVVIEPIVRLPRIPREKKAKKESAEKAPTKKSRKRKGVKG